MKKKLGAAALAHRPRLQNSEALSREVKSREFHPPPLSELRLKPRLNDLEQDVSHIAGRILEQISEKDQLGDEEIRQLRVVAGILTDLQKSSREDARLEMEIKRATQIDPSKVEFSEAELIELLAAEMGGEDE